MKRVTSTGEPLIEQVRPPSPDNLETVDYLNHRYAGFRRRLAFPESASPKAWRQWRRSLRRSLRKVLRLAELGPVPTPRPTTVETVQADGYQRHKLVYETLPGSWVTAYLLVPDGLTGPGPAAICAHGHFEGGKDSVALPDRAAGVAYGHELARRGVVVLAPDKAGMGERQGQSDYATAGQNVCWPVWARLNQMGLDLTGLRVFELMAGISLLSARPDVDARRIGAAGLSGGCWLSQVLSALDRRVRAVVLSGFFTTFVQTVWHGHCICHHPFAIGRECDLPDLSALIAPRPQFVESGKQDEPYPLEPAYSMVRRAYELLGAPDRLGLDHYDGGHMFHGEHSVPWLVRQLS